MWGAIRRCAAETAGKPGAVDAADSRLGVAVTVAICLKQRRIHYGTVGSVGGTPDELKSDVDHTCAWYESLNVLPST